MSSLSRPEGASSRVLQIMHPEGTLGKMAKWTVLLSGLGAGAYGVHHLLNKYAYLKGLRELAPSERVLISIGAVSLLILGGERATGLVHERAKQRSLATESPPSSPKNNKKIRKTQKKIQRKKAELKELQKSAKAERNTRREEAKGQKTRRDKTNSEVKTLEGENTKLGKKYRRATEAATKAQGEKDEAAADLAEQMENAEEQVKDLEQQLSSVESWIATAQTEERDTKHPAEVGSAKTSPDGSDEEPWVQSSVPDLQNSLLQDSLLTAERPLPPLPARDRSSREASSDEESEDLSSSSGSDEGEGLTTIAQKPTTPSRGKTVFLSTEGEGELGVGAAKKPVPSPSTKTRANGYQITLRDLPGRPGQGNKTNGHASKTEEEQLDDDLDFLFVECDPVSEEKELETSRDGDTDAALLGVLYRRANSSKTNGRFFDFVEREEKETENKKTEPSGWGATLAKFLPGSSETKADEKKFEEMTLEDFVEKPSDPFEESVWNEMSKLYNQHAPLLRAWHRLKLKEQEGEGILGVRKGVLDSYDQTRDVQALLREAAEELGIELKPDRERVCLELRRFLIDTTRVQVYNGRRAEMETKERAKAERLAREEKEAARKRKVENGRRKLNDYQESALTEEEREELLKLEAKGGKRTVREKKRWFSLKLKADGNGHGDKPRVRNGVRRKNGFRKKNGITEKESHGHT